MTGSTLEPPFDFARFAPTERAVLLFLERPRQGGGRDLLLIRKKRGLGAGKVNAPGGRIEPNESEAAAAVRECFEEVGVTAHAVERRGALSFQFVDGYALHCTVFTSRHFSGEPHETDEAIPFWCHADEVPYDEMWADDRHWLPELLLGHAFDGYFVFDGDEMLSMKLDVVVARAP